jgi:hypothetical protein
MTDRIIFNGQEYESTEAMPQAVRAAYQEALSKIRQSSTDATNMFEDGSTISPALFSRPHSEDFLRAHYRAKQTAARVLPILLGLVAVGMMTVGAWMVWHLNASVRGQGGDLSVGPGFLVLVVITTIAGIGLAIWMTVNKEEATPPRTRHNAGALRALDRIEHIGTRMLQILLGVAAGGVVAVGFWMISGMDASSRSQAGDIFVGIGVLVALACIAGMYISLEMRLKK